MKAGQLIILWLKRSNSSEMMQKNALVFTLFLLISSVAFAQSLPVGMPVIEDSYRREQLLGTKDSLISFTIRPIYAGDQLNSGIDTISVGNRLYKFNSRLNLLGDQAFFQLLPLSLQHQYNSILP